MTTDAIAYRPWWHVAAVMLGAASRGSALAIVALLFFLDAWLGTGLRLGNPLRLLRAFAGFCLLPGIAAWLLARSCAMRATVEPGVLALERHGRRIEIPLDLIDHVAIAPMLTGGLRLRFTSGRRFRYTVQVADPVAFIEALVAAGAPERLREAARTPGAVYARATARPSRRWYHPVLTFVVFALVPALPLFRLHQWIAYGGTFGEYYAYGLQAYLLAFALYWATSCVYLVLYDAVLRAVTEPVVWLVARWAPSRTGSARRVATMVRRLLFFGGVPLFLLRLFLAQS
jgi:apolipoprotein N-acyltransferase